MAVKLSDLIEEWLFYHPKLHNHFKVIKFVSAENPTTWPFDQDAYIGMVCEMKGHRGYEDAVCLIASDFVMTNPNTIIAAEPNFLKMLEDWLVAFHNNCYHLI